MNKAIFLDRDGVINIDSGYVSRIENFRFMDGIFHFCQTMQKKGYLIIVVTNQAGIARSYYTESDFHILNNWMIEQFMLQGVHISKTYFCPYHPEYGVREYKYDSPDRKPHPGMILKAAEEFAIDLSQSILVGDKVDDMIAAHSAGIGRMFFLLGRYNYTDTGFSYDVCSNFEEILLKMNLL